MESFSFNKRLFFLLCLVAVFLFSNLFFVGEAAAQTTRSKSRSLGITKFTGIGSRAKIKTPQMASGRGIKAPKDWMQLEVVYDTAPEWIDGLEFRFYAMAIGVDKVKKAKVYSFYQVTQKYSDIEKGRDHRSAAYLRPEGLKRYGELVGAAVEILYNGELVDSASVEQKGSSISKVEKWWTKTAATPSIVTRNGYLLKRSETPFFYVNIDDYEFEK